MTEQPTTPRKGRNSDLINMRNRALVARYYYWSILWERRYDRVLHVLECQEFYISHLTIHNIIQQCDDYLAELISANATAQALAGEYPGFAWKENTRFSTVVKQQMKLF